MHRVPYGRERRRLLEGHGGGLPRNHRLRGEAARAKGRSPVPKHGIARLQGRASPAVNHETRTVAAWRARITWISSKHVEHVTEVETNGTHIQVYFASSLQGWQRTLRFQAQVPNGTSSSQMQMICTDSLGGGARQPRNSRLTVTHDDLRLGHPARSMSTQHRRHRQSAVAAIDAHDKLTVLCPGSSRHAPHSCVYRPNVLVGSQCTVVGSLLAGRENAQCRLRRTTSVYLQNVQHRLQKKQVARGVHRSLQRSRDDNQRPTRVATAEHLLC